MLAFKGVVVGAKDVGLGAIEARRLYRDDASRREAVRDTREQRDRVGDVLDDVPQRDELVRI